MLSPFATPGNDYAAGAGINAVFDKLSYGLERIFLRQGNYGGRIPGVTNLEASGILSL
jgi:hypothetical protein